ncbi:DUF262 domain-containing protein [Rhodococcus qingshengii]|uniref:DUF262 domain-containing protein n=1 Tax=Rhodococcus qingshengii TaxID=334542 RepID=UPI001C8C5FF1|nr:DUF262 domain-containing protein [Rhodococcus qingshengii]MBX9151447.1 DUF262 domain-containing protein [Rhodococcus qingshengii]
MLDYSDSPIAVTKTVYTVTDFLGWHRQGELNLRPYFQRGDVWTPKAKSYLIDTLLRGYPVPIIYLQNKQDRESLRNIRQVVDGQQRLRTILGYIAPETMEKEGGSDRFTILKAHNAEFAGKTFRQLPEDARDRIANTELSVHVLQSGISDGQLLQLFARLNSTGERLTDQELRNAEYHGSFKSAAYRLSYEQLDRWRNWNLFTPRLIAKMRDVEMVSELILLTMYGLQAKTKQSLDRAYETFDDNFPLESKVERRVHEALDAVDYIYEFLLYEPEKPKLNTISWFYTLFAAADSSLHGPPLLHDNDNSRPDFAHNLSISQLKKKALQIQDLLESGKISGDLARALRGASSDLASRAIRLDFLLSA